MKPSERNVIGDKIEKFYECYFNALVSGACMYNIKSAMVNTGLQPSNTILNEKKDIFTPTVNNIIKVGNDLSNTLEERTREVFNKWFGDLPKSNQIESINYWYKKKQDEGWEIKQVIDTIANINYYYAYLYKDGDLMDLELLMRVTWKGDTK